MERSREYGEPQLQSAQVLVFKPLQPGIVLLLKISG